MRLAGVCEHGVLILDGTEHLSPAIFGEVSCIIKDRFGQEVASEDVAMWVDNSNGKLILTADELYYYNDGEILKWNLSELRTVDWERKKDGYVQIGSSQCYILLSCRKPFVEAMKKILLYIKSNPVY